MSPLQYLSTIIEGFVSAASGNVLGTGIVAYPCISRLVALRDSILNILDSSMSLPNSYWF